MRDEGLKFEEYQYSLKLLKFEDSHLSSLIQIAITPDFHRSDLVTAQVSSLQSHIPDIFFVHSIPVSIELMLVNQMRKLILFREIQILG